MEACSPLLRNSARFKTGLAIGLLCTIGVVVYAATRARKPVYTPEQIASGEMLFTHEWTPGDPLAGRGDGLGPVFNKQSCVACHFQGGTGGAGPNSANVMTFEVMPAQNRPEVHSGVVHASAVDDRDVETPETVNRLYPEIPAATADVMGGCIVTIPARNPVRFDELNTPPLFGIGEIQQISDAAIEAARKARMRRIMAAELRGEFDQTAPGKLRYIDGSVGKFGWKGQFSSVQKFVAVACAVEMGLTNPLEKQLSPQLFAASKQAELDLNQEQFTSLVGYVETLPRPRQRLPDSPRARLQVEEGGQLFAKIGCAECHTPNLGGVQGIYCDFLLYRLESDPESEGGGYGSPPPDPFPWPEDLPESDEWQTPPLWGVADSAPYFHDGRSPTLDAAIQRHGGDAVHVRENYRRLKPDQRRAVIAFLKSLRAPELKSASQGANENASVTPLVKSP